MAARAPPLGPAKQLNSNENVNRNTQSIEAAHSIETELNILTIVGFHEDMFSQRRQRTDKCTSLYVVRQKKGQTGDQTRGSLILKGCVTQWRNHQLQHNMRSGPIYHILV